MTIITINDTGSEAEETWPSNTWVRRYKRNGVTGTWGFWDEVQCNFIDGHSTPDEAYSALGEYIQKPESGEM